MSCLSTARAWTERSGAKLEVLCSLDLDAPERIRLEQLTRGAPAVELCDAAGPLQTALAARARRPDYQLCVLSVPGAGFGREVHAPESDQLIAEQPCPVLGLREGT